MNIINEPWICSVEAMNTESQISSTVCIACIAWPSCLITQIRSEKALSRQWVYMYLGRQRKGGTLDRKNSLCIASFPGPAQLSAAWCTKKRQTLSFWFFVHVWEEERGYMFFALDSAEEPRNKASTLQVQTFMYLAFSQASHIFVHRFAFSIIHRNGRAAKKRRRPRSN